MSVSPLLEIRELEVEAVRKNQNVRLIRDVSLDVHAGEFLAVVGESGSGKTMTMLSVLQLLPPGVQMVGGEIRFTPPGGASSSLSTMHRKSADLRRLRGGSIGMVFQDTMSALNPSMRVGQQVAEAVLVHRKMSKAEALEIARNLFVDLGIPDPDRRMTQYPHEFSGGMRQRAMIAMALANSPHLIIADEPTTALDVTIQAQIMSVLKRLQERGIAIVLISHNLNLVGEVADRVAVMYLGRVMEYGRTEDIFNSPSHPYTVAQLNSIPDLDMPEGSSLRAIPGSTPSPRDVTHGCEFASRCSLARDACTQGEVPVVQVGDSHWARCVVAGSAEVARLRVMGEAK